MNSGKAVTIAMLLIALVAAVVAWWHNAKKGQAALEFWGGDVAYQIRTANDVELWLLSAVDSAQVADRQEAFGEQLFAAQFSARIEAAISGSTGYDSTGGRPIAPGG